ncbi:DNA polymerase III subunit gamma/tau, partial [Candidatus Amesbacteria bacterium]|nr:DNA polymerase III subunit gamma/tau [Candidatus Amesbacteria bacterium]
MTWYLKYRPQKIEELDLVGVRERLRRTLSSGKDLPHAWLFAGPRGTGKTSAARILAKAVNCELRIKKQELGEPCNKCNICKSVTGGSAPDVMEIDAASNRGIDEIRELRERVGLAPMQAKYKVYIIDEAHMLTTEAANALLKTLEEPPAHAIFILCTTEAEKLPETVRSRCAEVEFKKPSVEEIVEKLEKVAKGEELGIKNQELREVAKAARGSFRDAIKILEQVILAGGDVAKVIDNIDPGEFLEMEVDEALKFINKLVEDGVNLRGVVERCVEVLRERLLETKDVSLIGKIEGLEKAYERMKTSAVVQLPLEIFVIENMTNHKPQIPNPNEAPMTKP